MCMFTSLSAAILASPLHSPITVSTTASEFPGGDPEIAPSVTLGASSHEQSHDESAIISSLQKNQDPYVKASPLSVAAVCSDGIALLALHYESDDDCSERDEEKLMIADDVESSTNESNSVVNASDSNGMASNERYNIKSPVSHKKPVFRDLPISTRGPLRIEQVYDQQHFSTQTQTSKQAQSIVKPLPPPMALLTAGWRTDGMTLANAARELIAEERMLYCLPYLAMPDGNGVPCGNERQTNRLLADSITTPIKAAIPYYGRRIAEGLSYYMAKRDFSESTRSLSTVGMLTVGSNNIDGVGSIFLVDATGAYRVRAHAIGNGAFELNQRLGYVDFSQKSCRDGLEVLMRLIAEEGGLITLDTQSTGIQSTTDSEKTNNDAKLKSDQGSTADISKPAVYSTSTETGHSKSRSWNLPQKPAIEMATLSNGDSNIRRVRFVNEN